MTRNLLKAGYTTVVFDVDAAKCDPLPDAGTEAANSPGKAAARSVISLPIVMDDTVLRQVALAADSVAPGASPGHLSGDLSTVSPAVSLEVATTARRARRTLPRTGRPAGRLDNPGGAGNRRVPARGTWACCQRLSGGRSGQGAGRCTGCPSSCVRPRYRGISHRLDFAGELITRMRAAGEAAAPPDLHDGWVDKLTVSGIPGHCAARIGALHAAGAGSVCLISASDHEQFLTQSAEVLTELEDARR